MSVGKGASPTLGDRLVARAIRPMSPREFIEAVATLGNTLSVIDRGNGEAGSDLDHALRQVLGMASDGRTLDRLGIEIVIEEAS